MQQLLKDHPKLRSFAEHGVVFTRIVGDQAEGTCSFCDRQRKFYAHVTKKAWDCKVCLRNGGLNSFLAETSKQNQKTFQGKSMIDLIQNRKLKVSTFRKWQVGWNGIGYTIPAGVGGVVTDLRRYLLGKGSKNTSGSKAGLMGVDAKSSEIWLCEGEWDGMALYEAFSLGGRVAPSIYAVEGAGSFPQSATGLFQNKTVNLVFDNDHAGEQGMLRASRLLEGIASSVKFVHWPSKLPTGFDIRDLYLQEKEKTIEKLRLLLHDKPATGSQGDTEGLGESKTASDLTGHGLKFNLINKQYKQWLHMPKSEVLAVLFGAVLANRLDGDPLWLFFVGPPGSAKTELLMSLSEAPLIITTTSLTPHALVSGANFLGGGDPSLIPKLNGKVLVIKDFTTILNMNSFQRDEIFGILRDAYDGQTEKWFGNGVHRKYFSRFGILAGVTNVIEAYSHSSSVLGERFLKYKIRLSGRIDIGRDEITRALQNIARESKMRLALQETSKKALERNITKLPTISKEMAGKFLKLAQWVAALRGVVSREKYTGEILFKPSSEIGTRLAKQLAKLAIGVALVKHKDYIDQETYDIVCRVGQDTAPDRVEEVVRQLYLKSRNSFATTSQIAEWTRFPTATCTRLLQDLDLLHIVQKEEGARGYWQLSRGILRLMDPLNLYKRERAWKKSRRN